MIDEVRLLMTQVSRNVEILVQIDVWLIFYPSEFDVSLGISKTRWFRVHFPTSQSILRLDDYSPYTHTRKLLRNKRIKSKIAIFEVCVTDAVFLAVG